MNRTRAQRRRMRQGYTHEAAYWSAQAGRDVPYNFILLLRPGSARYFRKHRMPDDWIRPVCPVLFHNGRKPR